jgi:hypothetical protein
MRDDQHAVHARAFFNINGSVSRRDIQLLRHSPSLSDAYRRMRAAEGGLGHQGGDSQISLFWTLLPAWRCCSVTRAQPNRKAS